MLTKEEKKIKLTHVGSSDAARIMGISPFGSKLDVYLEKKHGLFDSEENEAIQLGVMLEPVMVNWWAEVTGVDMADVVLNHHSIRDWRSAQHDAVYMPDRKEPEYGVEAKTSGLLNPYFRSHEAGWGETTIDMPSDQVPDFVLVQIQHQMEVAGIDRVYCPALIANEGRQLYLVHRDEQIIKAVIEAETRFMEDYFIPGVQPPMDDRPPSLSLLRQIKSIAGKVVEVADEEILLAWQNASDAAREANKAKDGARNTLLGLLKGQQAEALDFPSGIFSYNEEGGARKTDFAKLEKDFPDAYTATVIKGTRMVPRFKRHKIEGI